MNKLHKYISVRFGHYLDAKATNLSSSIWQSPMISLSLPSCNILITSQLYPYIIFFQLFAQPSNVIYYYEHKFNLWSYEVYKYAISCFEFNNIWDIGLVIIIGNYKNKDSTKWKKDSAYVKGMICTSES